MKTFSLITATVAFAALSACTTTGNVERNATIGALGGAIAGAVIGNNTGSGDASTGAKIGAVVGGAGGAYSGTQKDKAMGESTRMRVNASGQELMFDESTRRYYYIDERTGKSYYQNGQLRG